MSHTGRNRLTEKNHPTAARNGEPFWIMVGISPNDDLVGQELTVTRATTYNQGASRIPLRGPTRVTSTTGSFLFDGLVFEGLATAMWGIKFTLQNSQGDTLGSIAIGIHNLVAVARAGGNSNN